MPATALTKRTSSSLFRMLLPRKERTSLTVGNRGRFKVTWREAEGNQNKSGRE